MCETCVGHDWHEVTKQCEEVFNSYKRPLCPIPGHRWVYIDLEDIDRLVKAWIDKSNKPNPLPSTEV